MCLCNKANYEQSENITMKLTSNYAVYLDESNKVYCAKCLKSGRFVKRVIAQNEYEKEYGFYSFSFFTMFLVLVIMYLSNLALQMENVMKKVTLNLDQVLTYFSNGYTIVLFTHLNTYLFKSKVNNEKDITSLLNTGEVKGDVFYEH